MEVQLSVVFRNRWCCACKMNEQYNIQIIVLYCACACIIYVDIFCNDYDVCRLDSHAIAV